MRTYRNWAELAKGEEPGRDYWRACRRRDSRVVVIAPHGGRIEAGTDRIARAIAGRDFSWYVFLAVKAHGNRALHLRSTRFDDPRCLKLAAAHERVLTVHGCGSEGEAVFLGGLDEELKTELARAFRAVGLRAVCEGHPWPGRNPLNICNRGARGMGVQLELSWGLRQGPGATRLVRAVREVLMGRNGGAREKAGRLRRTGWLVLLGLLGLGGCGGLPDGAAAVQGFVLERYLGRWHEIARLDHSFERGLEQVTADYSLADGRMRVVNRGRDAASGAWKEAVGKALPVGQPGEGRLKVSFFGPFYGAYNIIALEPDYSAALVCGPDLKYLWILARAPRLDPAVQQRFLDQARALGFPVEELIWVKQES